MGGSQGGLGGNTGRGIRDARLVERALRERWPISKALRGPLIDRLAGIVGVLVQVSQIPRRFASGPAGEIPPGESIVERCWRPGSPAEVSLTLFG